MLCLSMGYERGSHQTKKTCFEKTKGVAEVLYQQQLGHLGLGAVVPACSPPTLAADKQNNKQIYFAQREETRKGERQNFFVLLV